MDQANEKMISADGFSKEEIEALKSAERHNRDLGAADYVAMTEADDGPFQLRAEEDAVLHFLNPKPSDLVLDAGAGVGRFTVLLAPRVRRVVAVDLSRACLDECAARAEARGIQNIELVQEDLCRYEGPPDHFDKAYSFEVFQHIPSHSERVVAMRRIFKACKPGAMCAIIAVGWNRRSLGMKEAIKGDDERRLYFFKFAPHELRALLQEAGFERTRTRGLIVLPRRLTRRLPDRFSKLELLASHAPFSDQLGSFVLAVGYKPF